ncbi:type 1 glutamine amidotransferase [Jiulongibacter sediminis]|uniref:type 1 glutamine amidotransferase n=1 Tax=Jiulongibacter sediminis TaxID=1605367 RepID=UPI0026E946F5|nr:GMP synthase [Jiulongibacter sediminis]
MNHPFRIAILDFYNDYPNEGMRCIKTLIERFFHTENIQGSYKLYDVRGKGELPTLSEFDAFIGTGGPGSPIFEGEQWEADYGDFLDEVLEWNKTQEPKKQGLLICHSYQMMVQHYHLALVCSRKSTSFGVMPVHKTEEGLNEPLFEHLEDPFWAVDSRDYQVIQPHEEVLNALGAKIIALEKIRPHVPLERAIMGIRLSDEIVGLQFHPEADPEGMRRYFRSEDKRMAVITEHGEEKLHTMLEQLEDEDKIRKTESVIIPDFLKMAAQQNLETC